jgi:hypothetical protein
VQDSAAGENEVGDEEEAEIEREDAKGARARDGAVAYDLALQIVPKAGRRKERSHRRVSKAEGGKSSHKTSLALVVRSLANKMMEIVWKEGPYSW